MDIDKHPTPSRDMELIPTFAVYSGGKSIGKVVGGSVFEKFESGILPLIKKMNNAGDGASGKESWRQTTLTPRRRSK